MRFSEIRGGLIMPTSNEEQKLIDKIKTKGRMSPESLNERECELATKLVSRGLLDTKEHNNKPFFVVGNSGLIKT